MLSDFRSDLVDKQKVKPYGKRHGVRHKDRIVYKIIMCGGSNRGQTSYITRYTTGQFDRTVINPTIGGE